jgi:hypothetical protein
LREWVEKKRLGLREWVEKKRLGLPTVSVLLLLLLSTLFLLPHRFPCLSPAWCLLLSALQELVLKDHALEPEGEALRKSAHLMVTGLAQSLALVTAKEPLRIAVANNLRALLTNQLDANTLEQVGAGMWVAGRFLEWMVDSAPQEIGWCSHANIPS